MSPVCAQVFKDRGHHVVEWAGGLSPADLKAELPKYDGIVVRSSTNLTEDIFPHCPNLKVSGFGARCVGVWPWEPSRARLQRGHRGV